MNELKIFSGQNLSTLKKELKNIKITTKDEAIDVINVLSAINAASDHIKKECYLKLDSCADRKCYSSSNGNEVRKVTKTMKHAIKDDYLLKLEKKLADLQEEIKDYKKALPVKEVTSRYYQAI